MAYGLDLTIGHTPYAIRGLPAVRSWMPTEPDGAQREENPVVVPIGDSLDLHAFAPQDVPAVLADYLEECARRGFCEVRDRKSTRLNSSHQLISYAVFCLKKKKK